MKKAAEQKLATAEFSLATMYALGVGVRQNHLRARLWLMRAAKQGHEEAIAFLAEE